MSGTIGRTGFPTRPSRPSDGRRIGKPVLQLAQVGKPVLLLLLLLVAGCATFTDPKATFHDQRKQRSEEAALRVNTHRDVAEFQAAQDRWNQQDVAGCREQLERLLARSPDHRGARLLMADVLLASNKPEEALTHLKAALKTNSDDADVQYAMGLTLDAMGRHDQALPYYERAAKAAPDNEVYAMGYRTAMTGQTPKKAAPASKAVSDPRPIVQIEFDDDGSGKDNKVRPAIAENPDNPQNLISAASAALGKNEPRKAVALLAPAVAEEKGQPRGPLAGSAAAHRILGVAYYRLGEYRSSQVSLQQALSLDKSNALSYFLLGCTLAKLGQAEAAEVNFRQAQALDPRYTAR
jgi:tetratricopeptide (TPR) repeat protein